MELHKLLFKLSLEKTVFFKNEQNNSYGFDFHPDILNKIKRISPDAVYVFNNQPLILFFDLTNSTDSNKESEIHKKVWSFDNSPIVFILKGKDISIYNALNYIKSKDSQSGYLEEIKISEEERNERFSFWNLQSGETWTWFQDEYLNKKNENQKRVNQRLFQNIKDVRNYLTDKNKSNYLDENSANSLILRLIFIRYLIDRGIKIDNDFISGKTVNEKRKNFILLISEPEKLNQLFERLNENFNGVLFKETDIKLNQIQANHLAGVFKGELEQQGSLFEGYFFEIFDFSIIPVEVISGIYESLINDVTKNATSAVYTPSFLVDYMLTDTVDKYLNENKVSECKIFEVAVGSGIFLVQSLRRMIEKEIELNGNSNKKEFSNKIRDIAKNNLFGIDINEEALKVTCFSIYIALLDYQQPKDIDKYPFPNLLGTNLFKANFFDTLHDFNTVIKENTPKFILGNPPWKNGSKDQKHIDYLKCHNYLDIVSDYQLAQSFTLRTKDFIQENTICSLIITGKSFYNSNAVNFKNYFLESFCLNSCMDLSAVRDLVFSDAKNPAMIINYSGSFGKNIRSNIVYHKSVKTNVFFKNFKSLVLEKFDIQSIEQGYLIDNNWLFKSSLYGNNLDKIFLSKFSFNNRLKEFIEKKSFLSGNGIKKGTPKKHFNDLIGLPVIETSSIKKYYTPLNVYNTLQKHDVFLEAGRDISLFKGEKILLGKRTKNETEINISILEVDSVFKDSVNSITINKGNKEDFYFIYGLLISDFYTYYQFMTSSSWGVYYPEIHKSEYLNFPIIECNSEIKSKFYELVNLIITEYKTYYKSFKLGTPQTNNLAIKKINELVYSLYEIKDYEKDLIDYTLNVSRYQFQQSKQHLVTKFDPSDHRKQEEVLKNYADVYIKEFEEIYYDEFVKVEIFPMRHFIAMNFIITDKKPKEKISYPKNSDEKDVLERLANNLSIERITDTNDPSKNLYIQKDIKGFESNSFYIIKPNEYKCWHRAMAWYDVAEFKQKIQEAELKRLNTSSAND